MYSNTTWLDRYSNRYQWAVQAYDQFVKELAPELQDSLQRREAVTVVVYGATQVGKTTLILDLLGLNTLTTDEVGTVLRGGQSLGKSATAMPIRYGRSADDSWYIAGEGPLTPEMACKRLGALRQEVEAGGIQDAEILDIRIPGRLFPLQEKDRLNLQLNIIDIPGINSRNEQEQRLVARLARRYVSVADLVLLVGRADSLGFLNEADLQIEALADWAAQPMRFRIVLTFSFSPESLRQQFLAGELSIERVRDVLVAEMGTHDYEFPKEFRSNLFVLELGDSLKGLERNSPTYFKNIVKVVGAFREELLANIELAAGPYARLYGAMQLDRVINARIEKLQKHIERQRGELEERRDLLIQEIGYQLRMSAPSESGIEVRIKDNEAECDEQRAKLEQIRLCRKKFDTHDFSGFFSIRIDSGVETVTWLKAALDEGEAIQRNICNNLSERLNKVGLISDWCVDDAPLLNYQRGSLLSIESRLDDYSTDAYFWSSNFREDHRRVCEAFDHSARVHGRLLRSALEDVLKVHEKKLNANLKRLSSERLVLESGLKKISELHRDGEEMCAAHAFELKRMEDSRDLVSCFELGLNSAFRKELQATHEQARTHPVVTQRFYDILHARTLLSEIEKMYQGKNF